MKYNSQITAIPQTWEKAIKDHFDKEDTSKILTNLEPHPLRTNLENKKQIYLCLVSGIIKTSPLINIFPFLEGQDLIPIYKTTLSVTNEAYLQSFQYKIINQVLNCKL